MGSGAKRTPSLESLSDFIDKEITTLTQLGWHIVNDEDHIYLHNRSNIQSDDDADVWLVHQRYRSGESAIDIDKLGAWVEYGIERQKPWNVAVKTKTQETIES